MDAPATTANCPVCGAPARRTCARCFSASYCGRECQKAAWTEHKNTCHAPATTEAKAAVSAATAEAAVSAAAAAPATRARVHDMGPLGKLLYVEAPAEAIMAESKSAPPHFVFISDRSSSMVKYSAMIVNRAVPAALERLGYPRDTAVTFITFDSVVERIRPQGALRDPTLAELAAIPAACRGCTEMAGVLPVVQQVFTELGPGVPVVIVAISDGNIGDKDETVSAAQAAAMAVGVRAAPVSVCLYRLMSSPAAEPDTRALTCIGAFNTGGKTTLVDIHTDADDKKLTEEITLLNLVEQLVTDLRPTAVRGVALAAPAAVLRRMPGDPASAELVLPCGQPTYVLLAPGADVAALTCGGAPLHLEVEAPLRDERAIATFLEFVESQLRLWAVMGARDVEIAAVIDWFRQLEALLNTAFQDAAVGPVPVRDRVRDLLARVHKRQSSVIGRILALANRDRVSALNSAQAAAFLRGDVKSSSTAKRALKTDGDLEFDVLCRNGVRALAAATATATDEVKNEETSFYSMARWSELFGAAQELLPALDELVAADILSTLGGLGLAFHGVQGDLPDPWGFHVLEVYLGLYLSESDLRTAALQGGGAALQFPGTGRDAPVNGVVPLRDLNPGAYDLYMRACYQTAELQASATLRGILARIPYDCLARDAAVLWCLVCQVGHAAPAREVELAAMNGLRNQVARALATATYYARASFAELAADLASEDPRPWLTGDRCVSGVLKPMALLLASPDCAALRADPPAMARALRTLYVFAAYHAARRAFRDGGRPEALHALLGLDLAESRRRSEVGAPFEEDGEYGGDLPVDAAAAAGRAAALGWMPSVGDFAAASRFAVGAAPVDLSVLLADHNTLRLGAAVEALRCATEDDRVDKAARTAKGPLPGDDKAVAAYLEAAAHAVYRADHAARLAAKRAAETRIRLERLVAELADSKDHGEFVAKLGAGIPNRSVPGYQQLEEVLLDFRRMVPLRFEKLWTIVLGRDREGAPVWADGNVLNGDYSPFARAFAELDPTGDLWHALRAIKARFGVYHYTHDGINRHDHGNGNPSYWAFGHPTLAAFREAVSAEEYATYVANHNKCCGFGDRIRKLARKQRQLQRRAAHLAKNHKPK